MSKKKRERTYGHRDIPVCLDGAAAAERDALVGKVRRSPAEAKRLKALEEQMRESVVTIRVMGVRRDLYGKIQRAHPSKNPLQVVDVESFVSDFIYKTGFEVEADGSLSPLSEWDRAEWDDLVAEMTEGEFSDLAQAVSDVNVKRADTGFLSHGSAMTEPSSQSSEQHESGE